MNANKKTIKVAEQLYRQATIETYEERAADGVMKKNFRMSISSDTPYKRYDWANDEYYLEMLDHSPEGMDASRLKAGLPILFNHDRNAHLARAGSYQCDGKKCEVSDLKWSSSQFAQEKMMDAMNGSLPDTSVGYQILDDGECVGAQDGMPIYKFKWAPYEASLVTVPADITVGVGRERQGEEKIKMREISISLNKSLDEEGEEAQKATKDMKIHPAVRQHFREEDDGGKVSGGTSPKIDVKEAETKAVAAERKRIADIQERSRYFGEKGIGGQKFDTSELAEQCIREGKTPGEFQDMVLRAELKPMKPILTPELGMNEKEKRDFSFCRAIMSLKRNGRLEGLEKEASDAHEKLIGKSIEGTGFYVPEDIMRGRGLSRQLSSELLRQLPERTRALFANSIAGAGAFVGTELMPSLIELLRNQMYVVAAGARIMSGLSSDVAIPRQSGGATASWLAEDSTASRTQQTVGQLNLRPHKLMASTAYSEQLLIQSTPDAESFVRSDLMAVIAVARDLAALHGTGVSGQPSGITVTAGVPTVSLASADCLTYAKAVAFETTVASANALGGRLGFITSVTARGIAKQLGRFANTDTPVWTPDNLVNGYPAMATNQVAAPGVVFGNWDDLILADWSGFAVLVDPYSLSLSSQISVVARMYADNGVRHAGSFAFGAT